MREPNALITTDALAREIGAPNLRVFDCTTYLEPPPPGSDDPYVAAPGRASFEAAHIPGADFLDIQGEFSDNAARLRFMMPPVAQLEAAFGRHGVGPGTRVVLYSIGTMMWATRFWWMLKALGFMKLPCLMAASTNGQPRVVRSRAARHRAIQRQPSLPGQGRAGSSTKKGCSPPAGIRSLWSSMLSARNSTRAWSRADMAGRGAYPAVSMCRRRV